MSFFTFHEFDPFETVELTTKKYPYILKVKGKQMKRIDSNKNEREA